MPIKIPTDLPAVRVLQHEGVPLIREDDAIRQDIRPLRIALLNLMPEKIKTETQIARLLGNTPLQIEMTLLRTSSHQPRNTSAEHMAAFYSTWDDVRETKFDALIVTGAPVETLPFENVTYWAELNRIFAWADRHVHRVFAICWGAQALLYHRYGIHKQQLPAKRFGIFTQRVRTPTHPVLVGFNDEFPMPISRHTEVRSDEIAARSNLDVLVEDEDGGVCLVYDRTHGDLHMFNHIEYDSRTLSDEYFRDLERGDPIGLPKDYFPGNDPSNTPPNTWRGHAHLLFANWVNYVYQTTPFDLAEIGQSNASPLAAAG